MPAVLFVSILYCWSFQSRQGKMNVPKLQVGEWFECSLIRYKSFMWLAPTQLWDIFFNFLGSLLYSPILTRRLLLSSLGWDLLTVTKILLYFCSSILSLTWRRSTSTCPGDLLTLLTSWLLFRNSSRHLKENFGCWRPNFDLYSQLCREEVRKWNRQSANILLVSTELLKHLRTWQTGAELEVEHQLRPTEVLSLCRWGTGRS